MQNWSRNFLGDKPTAYPDLILRPGYPVHNPGQYDSVGEPNPNMVATLAPLFPEGQSPPDWLFWMNDNLSVIQAAATLSGYKPGSINETKDFIPALKPIPIPTSTKNSTKQQNSTNSSNSRNLGNSGNPANPGNSGNSGSSPNQEELWHNLLTLNRMIENQKPATTESPKNLVQRPILDSGISGISGISNSESPKSKLLQEAILQGPTHSITTDLQKHLGQLKGQILPSPDFQLSSILDMLNGFDFNNEEKNGSQTQPKAWKGMPVKAMSNLLKNLQDQLANASLGVGTTPRPNPIPEPPNSGIPTPYPLAYPYRLMVTPPDDLINELIENASNSSDSEYEGESSSIPEPVAITLEPYQENSTNGNVTYAEMEDRVTVTL